MNDRDRLTHIEDQIAELYRIIEGNGKNYGLRYKVEKNTKLNYIIQGISITITSSLFIFILTWLLLK